MGNKIVPIVFAFDNNLLLPAKVCISSLLMNANQDTFYDIFILHSNDFIIDHSDFDSMIPIYKNCRIQYRSVGDYFKGGFEIRGITYAAYYRLIIPWVIPEYDKIIYSDVDVIFRMDLSLIYEETDLKNHYIAGVRSLAAYLNKNNYPYYSKLHLDPHSIIYSGNIIINSKKMREDNLDLEFNSHFGKKYQTQDQDIINIVCKNKIAYLPPTFCYTNIINYYIFEDYSNVVEAYGEENVKKAMEYGTVHYNGQKPWVQYCVNFDIWWEYYRKSIFYDPKFYFVFFMKKTFLYDSISFKKRLKILLRYFIYGQKKSIDL
jgi:UDP-glucose:(galactosyl)LPS alpha-1,2-glucosyltransferase